MSGTRPGAHVAIQLVLVGLGLAMIVRAVAAGGGPLSLGVVLGVLFCAAGGLRLWASRRSR